MSIKKQLLKSKPVCKVSFKISKEQAAGATRIFLAGDFNGWNETSDEMKALKDGSFSTTLELGTGQSYQFRYVADGNIWMNDNEADAYEASGFGDEQNGVVIL